MAKESTKTIAQNKKAHHDYFVIESFETGIELCGTEVKSLREGRIPFEISLNKPNPETAAAMREAKGIAKDPSVKGYQDLDELFADLKE